MGERFQVIITPVPMTFTYTVVRYQVVITPVPVLVSIS